MTLGLWVRVSWVGRVGVGEKVPRGWGSVKWVDRCPGRIRGAGVG